MQSENWFFLGMIFGIFLWLCVPLNFNNTWEVNNAACHIAIVKKYPDASIQMVKQVVEDNPGNFRGIIYTVNGKFSESCTGEGFIDSNEKRRLIPVGELLGVKK